jgi:hypothetical protein
MPALNRKAPIGGPTKLVRQQERTGQPGVGDPEVLARNDARHEAVAADVRKDLGRAEHEQRDQDDRDADGLADDRRGEDHEDRCPDQVDGSHDAPSVEPVGDGTGRDPEEEVRQLLGKQGERDQQRVLGQRGDEQRAGGQGNAVADVGDGRRRQQPAEAVTESRRGDGLDDAGGHESHRQEPELAASFVEITSSMRRSRSLSDGLRSASPSTFSRARRSTSAFGTRKPLGMRALSIARCECHPGSSSRIGRAPSRALVSTANHARSKGIAPWTCKETFTVLGIPVVASVTAAA